MDPIAYQDNEGIHWLQITVSDNGVCTEFKQASEADMATNTWKTLEPDQWPTIIPAYDLTVSQNHFVLSRDSANKISRHFFSKYTPPGPNQSPIDRVSNQVYLGAYWGPMTMLRDPEKNRYCSMRFGNQRKHSKRSYKLNINVGNKANCLFGIATRHSQI